MRDEYQTIREGAAIGATAPRGQIAVAGPDRATFLQGLLTNDIQALATGSGCYSAWLTPQGRMLTDMHVLQSDGMLLLDVPQALVEPTIQRLDQFLFSENVQLQSLAGSLTPIWVHGPVAHTVLERVLDGAAGLASWSDFHHERLGNAVVVRIDQLGVPGYCVFVDPAQREVRLSTLQEAGALIVSQQAIDAARIEAGHPVFGVDMTEETIPLEAGIEARAISFTKGCYVGQEVIIRVLHRGHGRVAKKLVGLRVEGAVPRAGARLFSGDRDIGVVTSAAESPRLGSVALGYVQRDFVEPGTAIAVGDADRQAAVVTSRLM